MTETLALRLSCHRNASGQCPLACGPTVVIPDTYIGAQIFAATFSRASGLATEQQGVVAPQALGITDHDSPLLCQQLESPPLDTPQTPPF